MASPATSSRSILKSVIETEFLPENLKVRNGRMDGSMGQDGAVAATFPVQSQANPANRLELRTAIKVQVFGRWDADADPARTIDPTKIEGWADRFTRAIKGSEIPGTADVWYFTVDSIEYTHDPTGAVTRFEANIVAHGANPGY